MPTSKRPTILGDSTGIALGLVVGLGGLVAYCVAYVVRIEAATVANATRIETVKTARDDFEKSLSTKLDDLTAKISIIDTRVTLLNERSDRAFESPERNAARRRFLKP